ncbi:MAG: ABC transporter substrate-binding protein, partial [Candidatus Bathyarchaeota archaeon]|nr:ABC transporter substrate-binding protein [Candidatus Bathyarchaeota archaeon]
MFGYKSAPAILTILLISFLISTTRAETGFPLTVTDDFGRNVTISAPPTRIVSTAPSNTEILFALGLGDRVVGVTKYCDWPPLVL